MSKSRSERDDEPQYEYVVISVGFAIDHETCEPRELRPLEREAYNAALARSFQKLPPKEKP